MEMNRSENLSLAEILEMEPALKCVSDRAFSHRRKRLARKFEIYEQSKSDAWPLVGWGARNPLLRTSSAWDTFFRNLRKVLRI